MSDFKRGKFTTQDKARDVKTVRAARETARQHATSTRE
jgi:hypothetical protein